MFDSSQYRISTGCGEPSTLHAEDGDYVVGGGGLRETELKRFLDLYSVRYHMQLGFKFFIIFCSLILCQATILSPLCRGVSDAGRPVWLREILPVRESDMDFKTEKEVSKLIKNGP
ncbi:uncharacterized protein LOC119268422 isoform X2 [Triticum dicoccoides]|uniref:uncharacterized protein LOC119268422 isoform X2 n=1 Tax=Triticum dicoccoides TaxID=85692 RepID=UPI00188E60F4|nr:uncharacterized protein LOC119268422 isoform X2 [Triticum dicoccoides]XP_044340586.1 uncharacterized protein LOC123061523 isoform X1 [Triticum aestivum]